MRSRGAAESCSRATLPIGLQEEAVALVDVNTPQLTLIEESAVPSRQLEADGQASKPRSDGFDLVVLVFSRLDFLHHSDDGVGRVEQVESVEMVRVRGRSELGKLLSGQDVSGLSDLQTKASTDSEE